MFYTLLCKIEIILNFVKKMIFHIIISFWTKKDPNFFFIQVGSGDGIKEDLIHSYVIKFHWRGILLEPVRYVFEGLVRNYKDERNLIFENIAISDTTSVRNFYYLKETSDPLPSWYDMLGSFLIDNVLKHKRSIPNIEKYIVVEKVRTITVEDLIKKHNVKKLDLLYIDAEGYDYEILKQLRFSNIKPRMILFEHKHLKEDDYRQSQKLLRKNNYFLIKLECDTFAFCISL